MLGGVAFEGEVPLDGNSDADVVLHALTNAISGITCVNILGPVADKMCGEDNITDSRAYLYKALEYMKDMKITHVSISIECRRPRITPMIPAMRSSISTLLSIPESSVGITATSGEGLSDFGKGLGIQCFACVTAEEKQLFQQI